MAVATFQVHIGTLQGDEFSNMLQQMFHSKGFRKWFPSSEMLEDF